MNFWQAFKDYMKRPFSQDMDAFHWFLFFGLVLTISVLWNVILRHIKVGI